MLWSICLAKKDMRLTGQGIFLSGQRMETDKYGVQTHQVVFPFKKYHVL